MSSSLLEPDLETSPVICELTEAQKATDFI
jgi:hypothetical protein